ncbi:hypothetical protein Ccrd_026523 [Cynara cardunculus var. scolymus]|uniref:Uncharacterized protein n=1 Tax=Cynara cardunculus var. scolymus TaxID=59895 RepID=A0A103P0J7_CYNCS|nr:hypothetical protein Ccrd_026523 [Cynara cardunculus var. scolymus]
MDMRLSVKDLEELEYEIKERIEWSDENPDADTDELEEKEMELDKFEAWFSSFYRPFVVVSLYVQVF